MENQIIKKSYKFYNNTIEEYHLNGQLHREDGPAYTEYNKSGNIKCEQYYNFDKYHREDGPAIIEYYKNGQVMLESYIVNGKYADGNKPSRIEYDNFGNIECVYYCPKDVFHRIDGPAKIYYITRNGITRILNAFYYINGVDVSNEINGYKNKLTKQMIHKEIYIDSLYAMRIACIENDNKELLDLVESKIITYELSN